MRNGWRIEQDRGENYDQRVVGGYDDFRKGNKGYEQVSDAEHDQSVSDPKRQITFKRQ